jgi:hypothetical protein
MSSSSPNPASSSRIPASNRGAQNLQRLDAFQQLSPELFLCRLRKRGHLADRDF